jgi:hypothetical protein
MTSLHAFADNVGRLSTQTIEARTHRFHSFVFGSTTRGISTNPTKLLLRYPSLLSTGWRNPHSRSSTGVNNGKAPLSFQVNHVTVGNRLGSKWIYNLDHIISQDKFGFNPENVNKGAKKDAGNQVANDLKIVFNNPESIDCEKRDQYVRSSRPSKVASRPKGFIHHLSIAGEGK